MEENCGTRQVEDEWGSLIINQNLQLYFNFWPAYGYVDEFYTLSMKL